VRHAGRVASSYDQSVMTGPGWRNGGVSQDDRASRGTIRRRAERRR
jgi:hypothetical protein